MFVMHGTVGGRLEGKAAQYMEEPPATHTYAAMQQKFANSQIKVGHTHAQQTHNPCGRAARVTGSALRQNNSKRCALERHAPPGNVDSLGRATQGRLRHVVRHSKQSLGQLCSNKGHTSVASAVGLANVMSWAALHDYAFPVTEQTCNGFASGMFLATSLQAAVTALVVPKARTWYNRRRGSALVRLV